MLSDIMQSVIILSVIIPIVIIPSDVVLSTIVQRVIIRIVIKLSVVLQNVVAPALACKLSITYYNVGRVWNIERVQNKTECNAFFASVL